MVAAGLQHLGGVLGVLLERGNAIVVPELRSAGGTSMMLLMELPCPRHPERTKWWSANRSSRP